jgi:hypothetical protein
MKMTIEKAVEFARDEGLGYKKHMDEHGVNMPSSITFYSKEIDIPLMNVQIPPDLMEAPMKQVSHGSALALGSFIGVDYVTISSDAFVSKMDANDDNKQKIKDGKTIRPSEDVEAQEAIMVLGVSKEGKVLNSINMYGRDDLGNVFFKEQNTIEHDLGDVDNNFKSWMLDFCLTAFNDEEQYKKMGIDFDAESRVALLMGGMTSLAELDFMFAFTEPMKDYFISQLGKENITDDIENILEEFFGAQIEDGE